MSDLTRRAAPFVLALLAGCATVRDAKRAEDPKNAVPGERTPTAAELGLAKSGEITLDDAVAAALRVHPTVLQTRRLAEAAKARVGEAEAAFLPTVSGNASLSYEDNSSDVASSKERHRFEAFGFQVSWLVFDFGRTPALARQAAAQWLAAQGDAKSAAVDVAFGVRSAYYTLVKEIQLRDVEREAVRQFQEHLDQVKEFVRVGTHIPYDETKAEVDLGNAKLALVQAEDAVLLDQANLAGAIGLAETSDWTPKADVQQAPPPATFDDSWALARRARPALAAAEAREEAALQLVEAQIAALYPQLSLGASYAQSGARTPFPWNWMIGPVVSWTPFDGFRNEYTIDEAVADLKAARADRALAEQAAWLDVRTSWLAIEDALRRLELTALVVKSAEENLRVAQGRFDAGAGTTIELTDARQALILARSDDVQAHADRDVATARLWKSVGATDREPPPAAAVPPEKRQ